MRYVVDHWFICVGSGHNCSFIMKNNEHNIGCMHEGDIKGVLTLLTPFICNEMYHLLAFGYKLTRKAN